MASFKSKSAFSQIYIASKVPLIPVQCVTILKESFVFET
jgi:hypothetical protein